VGSCSKELARLISRFAPTLLKPVIGLGGEKVGVEDVPQLVGKQAAGLLIPLLPGLVRGHTGMSGIDPDRTIIGVSCPLFLPSICDSDTVHSFIYRDRG